MNTNETEFQTLIEPFVINHAKVNDNNGCTKLIRDVSKSHEVLQYPRSDKYDYRVKLEFINLDKEAKKDIATGRGFRITSKQNINTNLKSNESIFSPLFGQGLQDESPYSDRYRCQCGKITGKLNNRTICPHCKTTVKYMGDDFEFSGWIIMDNYQYIHPAFFTFIRNFIGKNDFDSIILYQDELDQDGNVIQKEFKNQEESFKGIGLIQFRERFDEIISYYANKYRNKPNKMSIYNDIITKYRDMIWQHSIHVYTTMLRPYRITDGRFYFEGNNQEYNVIASEVTVMNNKSTLTHKRQEALLYHVQMKYMTIISNIDQMLSGKKGIINGLFGGKYNFMSRCVIIPDPELKVDEVALPYLCLMEMMKELIINNIQRMYSCNYMDAYLRWYEGILNVDPIMVQILETIIAQSKNGRGIPVLINRNPTLHYGSIMQMYCVKIYTDSYAMGLPLQILKPLNADFDGDVMNILWIINEELYNHVREVFNPRDAMFISRNNGYVDENMLHSRETLMNWNTHHMMGMDQYTEEELEAIKLIKTKQRENDFNM